MVARCDRRRARRRGCGEPGRGGATDTIARFALPAAAAARPDRGACVRPLRRPDADIRRAGGVRRNTSSTVFARRRGFAADAGAEQPPSGRGSRSASLVAARPFARMRHGASVRSDGNWKARRAPRTFRGTIHAGAAAAHSPNCGVRRGGFWRSRGAASPIAGKRDTGVPSRSRSCPGYLAAMEQADYDPFKAVGGCPAMAPTMGAVARRAALFAAHARLSRDVGDHRLGDLVLAHDHHGRAVAHEVLRSLPRSASGRGCAS